MRLPYVEIHSQRAAIGIDTEPGKFNIRQGRATLHLESTPATVQIHSEPPVVLVDNSRLRAAMNGGSMREMNQRIYSQLPDIARQGIRETNAKWERIADLTDGDNNPVATIAREQLFKEGPKIQITAPPSSDNVSFEAVLHKPEINITPGGVEGNVSVTPPEISFRRGGVQTYMKQYPSVTVEVRNLDLNI
ncbi:DUF6470 family protein [Paenibacillus thailandensis]|uniref:DUF6470 family protein n=1 Tax=Paenibacillus thailandensis TaxID=393250 RepID=A0ABW5R3J0_9BACL